MKTIISLISLTILALLISISFMIVTGPSLGGILAIIIAFALGVSTLLYLWPRILRHR